ncbi:MAG: hypothetical protein EA392_05330 [Cryomorphaceae bacterium]|nr:MAG: hypothetical protein EA392_05330 [Cryomorphaceae bacterium]
MGSFRNIPRVVVFFQRVALIGLAVIYTACNSYELDEYTMAKQLTELARSEREIQQEFLVKHLCPEGFVLTDEYGLSFEQHFNPKTNHSLLLSIRTPVLDAPSNADVQWVIELKRGQENLFWESTPIPAKTDEPHIFRIPQSYLRGSNLKVYVWNPKGAKITMGASELKLSRLFPPSWIPVFESTRTSGSMNVLSINEQSFVGHYSAGGSLVLLDSDKKALSEPISVIHYSTLTNNVKQVFNVSNWQPAKSTQPGELTFTASSPLATYSLHIREVANQPEVMIGINALFTTHQKVHRLALCAPMLEEATSAALQSGQTIQPKANQFYYLGRGPLVCGSGNRTVRWQPENQISSVQWATDSRLALFNLDYEQDHPLIHFPEADTTDYFVHLSASKYSKNDELQSVLRLRHDSDAGLFPQLLPYPQGTEAAILFTEHADWTNTQSHRAVCFGSEEITRLEEATGGFAYYDIPVTKSVFYTNPDSADNLRASDSIFSDLHATITTHQEFEELLEQLHSVGFEVCLHTPDQYTTTRPIMEEALEYMRARFSSPTWIDHGYNNAAYNNRENAVCDGMMPGKQHNYADLWKEYGIRYFWNPYYEDVPVYAPWTFNNHLQIPYSGFGHSFPMQHAARHPNYPDFVFWPTWSGLEVQDDALWDYYLADYRIEELCRNGGVQPFHVYPAWVHLRKGFWQWNEDSLMVASPGFNRALDRLSRWRDEGRLWIPTVSQWMDHSLAIADIQIMQTGAREAVLINQSNRPVHGISLALKEAEIRVADKEVKRKTIGKQHRCWFDLEAGESVVVSW